MGNKVHSWDSSILIFLTKVTALCRQQNIATDRAGLPQGIRRLLELAEVAPEQKVAKEATDRPAFLTRVGSTASEAYASLSEMLHFLGEVTLAFVQLLNPHRRANPVAVAIHESPLLVHQFTRLLTKSFLFLVRQAIRVDPNAWTPHDSVVNFLKRRIPFFLKRSTALPLGQIERVAQNRPFG